MSDDQTQDTQVTPPQAPVSEDQSAGLDNRPEPTVSADSTTTSADSVSEPLSTQSAGNLAEPPVSTPSASPVPDANGPSPTVSADSSQLLADSNQQQADTTQS